MIISRSKRRSLRAKFEMCTYVTFHGDAEKTEATIQVILNCEENDFIFKLKIEIVKMTNFLNRCRDGIIGEYEQESSRYGWQLACQNGHIHIVEWLYENWHTQIKINDYSPFRYAIFNGHLHVAEWLYIKSVEIGTIYTFTMMFYFVICVMTTLVKR